jgi:hypothetical protein
MIYIFHDPNNAASRDFVEAHGGREGVEVVEGAEACREILPGFQGYPSVVAEGPEGRRALFDPASWDAVEVFATEVAAGPVAAAKTRYTPKEFRLKKLTHSERIAIEQIIDPMSTDERRFDVRDIEKTWAQSEYVDLDDPDTVTFVNALEALGVLAAGRAAEILTP